MQVGLVRGSTFIHRRFKVKIVNFTHGGVRVKRTNKPDGFVYEIPFSQLPAKYR